MLEFKTLVPAYGRDYKTAAAVLADWEAGRDFKCAVSGRYCSKRDFENIALPWIRYNQQKVLVRAKR